MSVLLLILAVVGVLFCLTVAALLLGSALAVAALTCGCSA